VLITVLICNEALHLQTTCLFIYVDILGKFFLRIILAFKDLHASTAEVIVFASFSPLQFTVYSLQLLARICNYLINIFTEPLFLSNKTAINVHYIYINCAIHFV